MCGFIYMVYTYRIYTYIAHECMLWWILLADSGDSKHSQTQTHASTAFLAKPRESKYSKRSEFTSISFLGLIYPK